MARKKARRGGVGADKCFCLLLLKREVQGDAKVLKAVVDEVNVLRLCRSLGMAVADESNKSSMNKFDFGHFNPSSYDADFSRFIRGKLIETGSGNAQVNEDRRREDRLSVGCLFGKQDEVKAELVRKGMWSSACESRIQDQGVYCIEHGDESSDLRQFVVFVWMNAGLFAPENIRDTPTCMLRFLMSLSSNITCCISQEDFQLVEREITAAISSTSMSWQSCSVAFQVQKQEEQSDTICCSDLVKTMIPQTEQIKSVEFVSGVFPAIAVESAVPAITEWVSEHDVMSCSRFADWLKEAHEQYTVELTRGDLLPDGARKALLRKFSLYPTALLEDLQTRLNDRLEKTELDIGTEVFLYVEGVHSAIVEDAGVLFAIRCPKNESQMDSSQAKYDTLQQHLGKYEVLEKLDADTRIALSLPRRLQDNLEVLSTAFQKSTSAFEEVLEGIVTDNPTAVGEDNRGIIMGTVVAVWNFFAGSNKFKRKFRQAIDHHRPRLEKMWVEAVAEVMPIMRDAMQKENIRQQTEKLQRLAHDEEKVVEDAAFGELRTHLRNSGRRLGIHITILQLSLDEADVDVMWRREVEKEPAKVVCMYELSTSGSLRASKMGTCEFEPGGDLRKLTAVKTNQAIAVLVKDGKTSVSRLQFPMQADVLNQMKAERSHVRTFPNLCSLCSMRVQDRRIAFVFVADEDRLGKVALCRFNDSFTGIDVMKSISMDLVFGLSAPIDDILLTERALCAMDGNGEMQSYDLRSGQTSKRALLGSEDKSNADTVSGLLCLADELVLDRASVQHNKGLCVDVISSEDHRKLPTVTISDSLVVKGSGVGCVNDVLYVLDGEESTVYASELKITVRSDAYRIQRSGNGAKSLGKGCLVADKKTDEDTTKHWLRVFYHVFEKFPARSLIDSILNSEGSFRLEVGIAVVPVLDTESVLDNNHVVEIGTAYLASVMVDLGMLNKPLFGLNLAENVSCAYSCQTKTVRELLMAIVSFVPVQICRAEDNMLKLLQNGQDIAGTAKRTDTTSDPSEIAASHIAQSIRFGLLSPLLESWSGRCVVVTSMGKQSTGKSYFLNHLTGTTFAISGSRCTDGAWMSLRFLSPDTLLVVLDFEGLGSFERSEQEDIFLSVLNASVSMFTVFRMESRFDKDIDGLFSRFQKGVQLIKNDARLFRGLLFMSVKDVNMNDRQGVVDELATKLNAIFESSREHNFLTEMYAGQAVINCTPPFGTMGYYRSMENDAAKTIIKFIAPCGEGPVMGFPTGKAFLDCLRVVLAKISILDWTSMDKSTQNLLIADVKQKLPGILRTGCLISLPLVGDKTIPSHLKEDVLQVGTRKKLVVSMKELCEANPGFASKWAALNKAVLLDSIVDEEIDLGFDATMIAGKKVVKTIDMLFQYFLKLLGKKYGQSRLTTEDQSSFDSFIAFLLLRRKMKVVRWLQGVLGEHLSETRAQLGQRYSSPLLVYLARCQQKCTHCQLGCMRSATHSPNIDHSCCTDHQCLGRCEYDECRVDSDLMQIPPCSRSAGHEGKCECEKGEHTCGQTCVLIRSSNCDKTCSKRAGHSGAHRCSVQVHVCGAKCSAVTCNAPCLLDTQREHSVHKCAEVQCLHSCLMEGCKNTCGEKDHFHGQVADSRAFAHESGLTTVANLSEGAGDDASVAHMCAGSHACLEMCQIHGICEQHVHLKKSARTYTGARGSFEYVYQEMNGCKKHCTHVLSSGEKDHDGRGHSCLAQSADGEDDEQDTVHYCDVRCPSCDYYCNKHFGHMGLHATSHGNMRQTYFMAKTNDIDVEDRKYQVGERGIAEMCNLFCSKMGRGHTHYLSCESKDDEKCVYTADASEDHRRHCIDELFPPPGRDMDELLHAKFWSTIGWEDPCNEEERAEFAKCRFQCDASEHEGCGEKRSFCVLGAWHKPELKPEGADDGFSYVDGHKFECVHTVDSGKFHNIFVLDSSGSMSGQPWHDLLCACNEFGISRLEDGGENDLASYITFDNESRIICEGERLADAVHTHVPFSGWGTKFEKGLRAANEVLSRNNFNEFKPVLIFFSDGHPSDIELGITLAQHIRSTYAKYDLKAFVVGFGYVNLSVLQRVATEMGGEYRQVLNANELRTEFQRIAAVLCNSEASLALAESAMESA